MRKKKEGRESPIIFIFIMVETRNQKNRKRPGANNDDGDGGDVGPDARTATACNEQGEESERNRKRQKKTNGNNDLLLKDNDADESMTIEGGEGSSSAKINDDGEQADDDSLDHEEDDDVEEDDEGDDRTDRKDAKSKLPPFEMIPVELLPQILLFLDSTKEVFQLGNLSKSIRQAITPETVIRSAVFQGGKAQQVVEAVMTSVMNKSIHVPSTLRMLRLINGVTCERGQACFGFDLQKNRPTKMSKKVHRPYGLLICQPCAQGLSMLVGQRDRCWYMEPQTFQIMDRISHYGDQAKVLSCYSHREVGSGEIAGPYILGIDIKQIENTSRDVTVRKHLLQDKLVAIDEAETKETRNRREAFVDAYTTAMSHFEAFDQARWEIYYNNQMEKGKLRAEKKLKKTRFIYAEMEKLLEGYEHKSIALVCRWKENIGICMFDNLISQTILGPMFQAPSYATKKSIKAIVESLREAYDIFYENGFFGQTFPPQMPRAADYDATPESHKALVHYGFDNKTPQYVLNRAGRAVLSLLRTRNLAKAIFLTVDRRHTLEEVFVSYVTKGRMKWEGVARRLWTSSHPQNIYNIEDFQEKFDWVKRRFERSTRIWREYIQRDETFAFLSESDPPPHRREQIFTRGDALRAMLFRPSNAVIQYLANESLADRCIISLLQYHRRLFSNPQNYGYEPNVRPTFNEE